MSLRSPKVQEFPYSFNLDFECTNNVSKYKALILGLETSKKIGVRELQIFGHPKLVVS